MVRPDGSRVGNAPDAAFPTGGVYTRFIPSVLRFFMAGLPSGPRARFSCS